MVVVVVAIIVVVIIASIAIAIAIVITIAIAIAIAIVIDNAVIAIADVAVPRLQWRGCYMLVRHYHSHLERLLLLRLHVSRHFRCVCWVASNYCCRLIMPLLIFPALAYLLLDLLRHLPSPSVVMRLSSQ